jgi:hypothetical protein
MDVTKKMPHSHNRSNPMAETRQAVPTEEANAFLASIARRADALKGIEPRCPFDTARHVIAEISERSDLGQVAQVYAKAMLEMDLGDRTGWGAINDTIDARFGPRGLEQVRKFAANINRENGAMPCPKC